MRLVLTDKPLNSDVLPDDVEIRIVKQKNVKNYNDSKDVIAIAGSRAIAEIVADMNLPELKLYQLTSAGFDGVPLGKYTAKGISVANAGSVYSIPIAETVVFGILTMAKRLRKNPNNRQVKLQRHYTYITELANKKVLILGAGNIGTAVANRLVGFGMTIDGYARTKQEGCPYTSMIRQRNDLMPLINAYDYIVSTLPDSESTRCFVDKEFITHMKQTAVLVNVGRRAVIDEDFLFKALKHNDIGGAVLDIFEIFPNPIQNKFRRLSNVVVLPGVAAVSQEVNERLRNLITENIVATLNGNQIQCVINRKQTRVKEAENVF